jgi:hypothetical protein
MMDQAALAGELDMLLQKAGAVCPPERKPGLLAAYADMKRMAAMLRQPRTAADEPAGVFSLLPFRPTAP